MTLLAKAILSFCIAALVAISSEALTFGQTPPGKPNSRTENGQAIEAARSNTLRTYALRLKPGQDLREELEKFTKAANIRAGFIMAAVGSLKRAELRLADQTNATAFEQKFEIVSLGGTLSTGGVHLHISLSDKEGKTIGGHLVGGCLIYTTAEIIIGETPDLIFSREVDAQTGYKELRIRKKGRPHQRSR